MYYTRSVLMAACGERKRECAHMLTVSGDQLHRRRPDMQRSCEGQVSRERLKMWDGFHLKPPRSVAVQRKPARRSAQSRASVLRSATARERRLEILILNYHRISSNHSLKHKVM